MGSSYFKNLGWAQLNGKWEPAVLFTLVYLLIVVFASATVELIPFIGVVLSSLVTIALYPMQYSYSVAFLNNKRSGEPIKVESLFDGYNDWQRIILTNLLSNIYILLWTLLLVVPGIIKSIAYSQINYILKDNPEIGADAAIELSSAMMHGHKWRYFKLALSFIGWVLLVILTLGIVALWYTPYFSAAAANFYEYVKADYYKRIEA